MEIFCLPLTHPSSDPRETAVCYCGVIGWREVSRAESVSCFYRLSFRGERRLRARESRALSLLTPDEE